MNVIIPLPTTVPTPSSPPRDLNRVPLSAFSLPTLEDWLITNHATTQPLQSHHQVSEHCDGMFSKSWCK